MTTRKLETGTPDLIAEVTGHVATVTLNNPARRNALSAGMSQHLPSLLDTLQADAEVRVLVLTGAEGAFCAGGDVTSLGTSLRADAGPDEMVRVLMAAQTKVSQRLYDFPKPVIAALPGPAAGAGMSIALACDLRIACQSAFFAPAFGALGVSGDFGGSWYMTQLLGPARTKEIYFSSRRIDAAEALALGLVNRVVPDDGFETAVAELAVGLAAQAPLALAAMKANINRAATCDLASALEGEARAMVATLRTEDHKNAAQAFLQKRRPEFTGK